MNFLNDSLKTLKNVLAEGLDQKVDFDGSPAELEDEELRANSGHESDKLRKLCQHQADEVRRNVFIIALFSKSRVVHMTFRQTSRNNKKDVFHKNLPAAFALCDTHDR